MGANERPKGEPVAVGDLKASYGKKSKSKLSDPFRDLLSEMSEEDDIQEEFDNLDEENDEETEDENEANDEEMVTEEEGSSTVTSTSPTTTTVPLPKSCPAPDVTYNGSLLSTVEAFKDIHDVEFEVRTGPFPGDNQRCKLSCVKGQWVGPLCRTDDGKPNGQNYAAA